MSSCSILDHGAVGDGRTLNTQAIREAIERVHAAGGGRVVVPKGTFLSGTVELKSNITLHLEEGAVLLGSPDLKDYTARVWGHHNDITPWHFILAEDCENIALTGPGTIRGNGPAFWNPERKNEWSFWKEKLHRVSPMIEIVRCRHVLVERVRIEESAGWTLHGHDCDHMRIEGITIRNTFFGPNCDGIDLTGCHDVIIHGCDIATADDAIALKTSEYSRSCERVAISDCILRTSCVGVRIGYESRQDFRDIVVSNVVIPRCTRVIDLRAVEGCTIERVRFNNITASTDGGWPATRTIEVIQLDRPNVFKNLLPPEHQDYGKDRPLARSSVIRDVSFTGMDLVTDGRITIIGKPGQPIERIRFSDIRLRFPVLDDATPFREAQSTGFIPGDYADARSANAAFVVQHARDVEVTGLRLRWPEFPVGTWNLFESDNRLISPFWKGHEEEIRSGARRVPYHVLWARDAEVAVGGRHLHASEAGHPACQADGDCKIVWKDEPLA
jgi:polygalacturonase